MTIRFGKGLVAYLIWLALLGCNHIKDVQPDDKEVVPISVVQTLQKTYPKAKDFTFKTLLKGKIWIADFSVENLRLRTQVNDTAIISSVYERLSDDFLKYKTLTDKMSVKGGKFSELLRYAGDTSSTRFMNYNLDGTTYFLQYQNTTLASHNDEIILTSPNASLPCYVSEKDLPPVTKQFFQNNNLNLKFQWGQFTVSTDGLKTFKIYALNYEWPFFFDDDGNLVWSMAANNLANSINNVPNSDLGYPAILAKTNVRYSDFNVPVSGAVKSDFNGVISLRFAFQKYTGELTNPDHSINKDFVNELSEVYFNANTGNLIYDLYRGYTIY